jgi:hypothetical protein
MINLEEILANALGEQKPRKKTKKITVSTKLLPVNSLPKIFILYL